MSEHIIITQDEQVLQASLELVPNPIDCDAAWRRFYHHDLPQLELTDLLDELYALRPLLWGLPRDHWLRERVHRIEAELGARRGGRK